MFVIDSLLGEMNLYERIIRISPKERTFSVDDIWNEYEDRISFKGKLLPSSSAIMKEIASKMKKTPKAVQLLLKRKYDKTYPEEEAVVAAIESETSTDNVKTEHVIDRSNKRVESFQKTFKIQPLAIFEIEERGIKHRNKGVMKKLVKTGWAPKLAFFVWEKTKLSCKFDLKAANVTSSNEIKVKASCICGSALDVSCQQNDLSIDIRNIDKNYVHTRRYQASGEMKNALAEKLKHSSAYNVHLNQINELNPDNETHKTEFIPLLRTMNAKRVIKCLEKKSDVDPIDALLNWKESNYKNVIFLVSHSPFTTGQHSSLHGIMHNRKNIECPLASTPRDQS